MSAELREDPLRDVVTFARNQGRKKVGMSPATLLRLLDERDAAIRRAALDVETLIVAAWNVSPKHYEGTGGTGNTPSTAWQVLDPVILEAGLVTALAAEYDRLRAALRSQESQKPPETEDR